MPVHPGGHRRRPARVPRLERRTRRLPRTLPPSTATGVAMASDRSRHRPRACARRSPLARPRADARRRRRGRKPPVELHVRRQRQEADLRPADPRVRQHASSASSTPDGSLKRIVPPTPHRRRARRQERRRRSAKQIKLQAMNDAIRRDRNLMQRFPDEATHYKAREKALDDVARRDQELECRASRFCRKERRSWTRQRSSTRTTRSSKPLPHALKQKLDANDARARSAAVAGAERSRPRSSGSTTSTTPSWHA